MLPDEKSSCAGDKIRRVVLCSGQGLLRLYEEREKARVDDVYIMRVEQLYPVPLKALVAGTRALQECRADLVPGRASQYGAWHFMSPISNGC